MRQYIPATVDRSYKDGSTISEHSSSDTPKYWSDELESGNALIDQQHRELIRRFGMLESAIQGGQGYQEVKSLVTFLQRYVLTHFNTEEQDMLSYNYPRIGEHTQQHEQCKNRIFLFKKFVDTESNKQKILDVALNMVGLWVRDHILQHDLQYIQYTKEKIKTNKMINFDYHWSPEQSKLWSPEFMVGVKTIDEQHMKLTKWTEYLMTAKDIKSKEFQKVFDFIQGFIYTHFTDEELFMIDMEFPDAQQHTEAHGEIRNNFIHVQAQLAKAKDCMQVEPMVIALFQSYVSHIKETDIHFIKYYKNRLPI